MFVPSSASLWVSTCEAKACSNSAHISLLLLLIPFTIFLLILHISAFSLNIKKVKGNKIRCKTNFLIYIISKLFTSSSKHLLFYSKVWTKKYLSYHISNNINFCDFFFISDVRHHLLSLSLHILYVTFKNLSLNVSMFRYICFFR